MSDDVHDNPARNRFELDLDGHTAFATYRRDGGVLAILHTEVPKALNGRGIGSQLVRGLLEIARAEGLKIKPLCPFVVAYMDKHPDYTDVRA